MSRGILKAACATAAAAMLMAAVLPAQPGFCDPPSPTPPRTFFAGAISQIGVVNRVLGGAELNELLKSAPAR